MISSFYDDVDDDDDGNAWELKRDGKNGNQKATCKLVNINWILTS